VVSAALAVTSLRFAAGAGSDSGEQTSSLTAGLMDSAGGRLAVVAVGLVVLVIGFAHVYIGASRRFEDQLRVPRGKEVARAIVVTGVLGYIAKGIALVGVGLLFGWGGLGADPAKATGLDGALQTRAEAASGCVEIGQIGA